MQHSVAWELGVRTSDFKGNAALVVVGVNPSRSGDLILGPALTLLFTPLLC